MKLKNLFAPAAALALLFFAGCASQPLPLNYAPSSVLTLSGHTSVADFRYLPAQTNPKLTPNQIRNTALGSVKFDRNIDIIFKEAVFKELRFVGVKLDHPTRQLTGDIEEFLIDDLGYSVDWTLRVKYTLTDKQSGAVVYSATKSIQRKTNKFVNVFGALNETIKLNIEELIRDPDFAKAIQ